MWFLEEITRDMQGAPCSVQHSTQNRFGRCLITQDPQILAHRGPIGCNAQVQCLLLSFATPRRVERSQCVGRVKQQRTGCKRNERHLVAWNALLRWRCLLGWVLPQLRTTSSHGDWCAMTWFPGGISESFRSKKLLVVRHLVTSSANSSHSQARNRFFFFSDTFLPYRLSASLDRLSLDLFRTRDLRPQYSSDEEDVTSSGGRWTLSKAC